MRSDLDLWERSQYLVVTVDVNIRLPGNYRHGALVISGVRYIDGGLWVNNCLHFPENEIDQFSVDFHACMG